jgi:hypothetical protein
MSKTLEFEVEEEEEERKYAIEVPKIPPPIIAIL